MFFFSAHVSLDLWKAIGALDCCIMQLPVSGCPGGAYCNGAVDLLSVCFPVMSHLAVVSVTKPLTTSLLISLLLTNREQYMN